MRLRHLTNTALIVPLLAAATSPQSGTGQTAKPPDLVLASVGGETKEQLSAIVSSFRTGKPAKLPTGYNSRTVEGTVFVFPDDVFNLRRMRAFSTLAQLMAEGGPEGAFASSLDKLDPESRKAAHAALGPYISGVSGMESLNDRPNLSVRAELVVGVTFVKDGRSVYFATAAPPKFKNGPDPRPPAQQIKPGSDRALEWAGGIGFKALSPRISPARLCSLITKFLDIIGPDVQSAEDDLSRNLKSLTDALKADSGEDFGDPIRQAGGGFDGLDPKLQKAMDRAAKIDFDMQGFNSRQEALDFIHGATVSGYKYSTYISITSTSGLNTRLMLPFDTLSGIRP